MTDVLCRDRNGPDLVCSLPRGHGGAHVHTRPRPPSELMRLRAMVAKLEAACDAALTEQQRKRAWDEAGVTGLANQRNAALERAERAELQLRNVLALATRIKRRGHGAPTDADHLIRFCREAGIEPQILRAPSSPEPFNRSRTKLPTTDLRGTTIEPAPTDPNRPRAKR